MESEFGHDPAGNQAHPEVTEAEREGFLRYVRDHPEASIREAAEAVGRKRWEFRALLAEEEFEAAYVEARGRDPEAIRAEIRRRAIDGVEEPVFHGGVIVGQVRRYSDSLLAKMAEAHLPEFKRQQLPDAGADGALVAVERRIVVGIGDVVGLAAELGIRLPQRVDRGAPGGELPPAPPVLPDPSGD